MIIQTTRFGAVSFSESDLITFKEGLLGFSDLRQFVLLDDPNDEIFAWLQSCEEPKIAFPVLEPEIFMKGYKFKINNRNDIDSLALAEGDPTRAFTIITIPGEVTQATANLKAPVIINVARHLAKQIIVQENDYPIKFPVFAELQKRFVQNPSLSIRGEGDRSKVAVRIQPQAEVRA